jgi:hypothetical protein
VQLDTEDDAWGDDAIHLSDEEAQFHFSGPWHPAI